MTPEEISFLKSAEDDWNGYGRQISYLKSVKYTYCHDVYVKKLKVLWYHYSKYKKLLDK